MSPRLTPRCWDKTSIQEKSCSALSIAEKLGNPRLANTVFLGALSTRLDVSPETWLTVIERRVPLKYVELNREAFWEGRLVLKGA